MKISVMSDLHLEFAGLKDLPGGDLLILAGDIWLARDMPVKQNDADSRKRRKRYVDFCRNEACKYARVLVITGNHEPYGMEIEDMDDNIRTFLAEHVPQAKLLVDETEIIDGTAFLGTPLWARCGVDTGQDWAISRAMNDFAMIRTKAPASHPQYRGTHGQYRRFTPFDAYQRHQKAVAWLAEELPKHAQAVVIGHHAPSLLSLGMQDVIPRVYDNGVDDAYATNLHPLIEANPQIKLWIHGHTHRKERYEVGATKIIANPRGYFPDERCSRWFRPEEADFDTEDWKTG